MTTPGSPRGGPVGGASRAQLVLVVDDVDRNRKLVCDVLHGAGLRTVEAANGHEALAVAGERAPDLVLLDLQLPDIDGWEVARRLAANDATREIPLVALSAGRHAGGGAWLLEAGFAGAIEKPIDVLEFPRQVRRYLGIDGG